MLAYVRHEARLNARQVDGSTLRATLEEKARRKQLTPNGEATLYGPVFPDALSYLYQWFSELSRTRGASMAGIAPITYQDVAAWAGLTDNRPLPHEVDAIMALDAEWRISMTPDEEKPAETDAPKVERAWPAKKAEVS